MKQFKIISLHLILLLVLAGFVVLPPYLSNMRDQAQMNQVNFEKREVSSGLTQRQLSSAEKIQMMCSFGKQSRSVMMTEQKKPENTSINESQIQSVCTEELKNLQKIGIFLIPDSNIKVENLSYSLQTFVDISKPSTYVIIWKVNMEYDGCSIELAMDDQTHAIFSFSVLQQGNVKFIEGNKLIQIWREYLGLNGDIFSIDVSTNNYVLGRYEDKNQPFYLEYQSYKSKNYFTNSISFYTDTEQPQMPQTLSQ